MQKSLIAASISLAILAGCGGSNDNKNDSAAQKVNQAPTATNLDIAARQGVQFRGNLVGNDAEGSITFTLLEQPKLGTLTITDEATGAFIYTTSAESGSESIKFQVSDGSNTAEATLSINISGSDPLYAYQWHLNNSGQNAFSASNGKAGIDMKVSGAHGLGVTGEGVVVAVIDDGLEIAHEDLVNNTISGGSYNLVTGTIDPTPASDTSAHGTAVGGLIAAEGWNALGGRGVAPNAKLIGFNYLPSDQGMREFSRSHDSAYSNVARVLNQSYGGASLSPGTPDQEHEEELAMYKHATIHTADDKGAIFVKSAGNSRRRIRVGGGYLFPGDYRDYQDGKVDKLNKGMPFNDANHSLSHTHPYNLVVSALNAEGKLSSYSTSGSAVFLTAPGGEYGVDAPAMVTTDRTSCAKGYNQTSDKTDTPFQGGMHPLNTDCNYLSTMNGTSSAAPNTSGVVALIMSANPELDWRDVRHILATTAVKVDADIQDVTYPISSTEAYVAIPKWSENKAGYTYHNYYGFGLPNAEAAVKMAKEYDIDLGEFVTTEWIDASEKGKTLDIAIPDASLTGGTSKLTTEQNLIIESVQVSLSIEHTRVPDLAIELISPAGTRSVLMTPHNSYMAQSFDPTITGYSETPLLSNAFYGEEAKGEWTLKVTDTSNGEYSTIYFTGTDNIYSIDNNTSIGKLQSWSIRFDGHEKGDTK